MSLVSSVRKSSKISVKRIDGPRKYPSCEFPECSRKPYYNDEAHGLPRFCNTHKLDGMVNVKKKNQQ